MMKPGYLRPHNFHFSFVKGPQLGAGELESWGAGNWGAGELGPGELGSWELGAGGLGSWGAGELAQLVKHED